MPTSVFTGSVRLNTDPPRFRKLRPGKWSYRIDGPVWGLAPTFRTKKNAVLALKKRLKLLRKMHADA